MKHYDYIEWLLYKNNTLPIEKHKEMEQHLYNCHICLDIFLSLIDENEIDAASTVISEEFTANVIKKISDNKLKDLRPKSRNSFKYQFGYYIAVASVTIFLSLGGFYTNLVDSVPKITGSIKMVEDKKPNVITNISERIVNNTSALLSSIENIHRYKEEK